MADIFYRWHRADAPAFSAENAWSAPWGETFSADGSRYECRCCDGSGEDYFGEPCADCGGEGWTDADEGYSCCESAQELADYFRQHLAGDPGEGEVIVFAGHHAGSGCDGEPLAVPTEVIRRMTWQELMQECGE